MAGIAPDSGDSPKAAIYSRRHFAMIAWLRWRIFVNTLRGKGGAGELAVKILSYPFLALIIFGPAIGAGFGSWYLVNEGEVSLLAIPLWIIFALWQFIGVNTSATGPSFDLSTLIRFPIRYRDYFLIRLSFGLLDPPTLAGIACLLAMAVGIGIASPSLFPWAVPVLAVYAACNLFFSRMIYSWLERWLAQRRTRELVTGLFILLSIGIQFLAQFAQRLGHSRHGAPLSPWIQQISHILLPVNWILPPGLSAASLDRFHSGSLPVALAAFAGLAAYTGSFLLILHLRLHAQFRGEDLSEAPAAAKSKSIAPKAQAAAAGESSTGPLGFLPQAVAAGLVKEIRYLLRSGPKLYVLIMPVFIVFLFSMRTSGLEYTGMARHGMREMLFSYGCAYLQLIFVSLLYNSLGSDGAGVQFYFLAPLRMRDVMLAKNLLTFAIFAVEAVLIYIASAVIASPAPLDLTIATLAWSLFTIFLNMSIGNVRSIVSPKVIDPAKVRGQNVSGLNSLISLVVVAVCVGLGSLMLVLCRWFQMGYWTAAAVFLPLAGLSFAIYLLVLHRIDGIASSHVEDLNRELSKA